MSQAGKYAVEASSYHTGSAELQRANAVAAALEVISAKLSSGASKDLVGEMSNLALYADQIQSALKTK